LVESPLVGIDTLLANNLAQATPLGRLKVGVAGSEPKHTEAIAPDETRKRAN
jgi:hypothetical protein